MAQEQEAPACSQPGGCLELTTILQRLDHGDMRMTSIEQGLTDNTTLTRQIADNTAGFVAFADDLATGARFLCRCAKGIQFFLRQIVDPYWKSALVVGVAIYWLTHDHTLPGWVTSILGSMLG